MTEQPKALRLIEHLDQIAACQSISAAWALDAVNELERLYAVNQELVEALERCVPHVEDSFDEEHPHVIQARAALKKLEESHD